MKKLSKLTMRSLFIALALAFMSGIALSGCNDPGPAEQAGQEVDEAMEDARDALDDLGDEAEDVVEDIEEDY